MSTSSIQPQQLSTICADSGVKPFVQSYPNFTVVAMLIFAHKNLPNLKIICWHFLHQPEAKMEPQNNQSWQKEDMCSHIFQVVPH